MRAALPLTLTLGVSLFAGIAMQAAAQGTSTAGPPPVSSAGTLDKLPTFEVATIKPVDHSKLIEQDTDIDPSGQVKLNGFSLKAMVAVAFDLRFWQLSGGDPWVEKDEYNVVADPPEEFRRSHPDTRHGLFTIDNPQLRQMIQALLIDRFQLRFHRETKTGNIYLLETNGRNLLLHPTTFTQDHPEAPPDTFSSVGFAGRWVIADTSMPQLAKFASDFYVRRPVLDRTGLTGAFDYRSPEEDSAGVFADVTGAFLRMMDEIGLKFVPAKGPVETLVIDRAERPSPN